MEREITVQEASKIYGMSEDRLKVRFHRGDFRTAKKIKNKWYAKRGEIEWRHLAERARGLEILTRFRIFRELPTEIKPSPIALEEFFGEDPGCLASIIPGGVPYALALWPFLIERGKDTTFICLGEVDPQNRVLIQGTKVLIVDDVSHTGKTIERAKEVVERRKTELEIKAAKAFVYDDFAKIADFWVRREYDEFFRTIALNLRDKK